MDLDEKAKQYRHTRKLIPVVRVEADLGFRAGYAAAITDAAAVARREGEAGTLPADRWDKGYRRASENIAAAIEALVTPKPE